MRATIGILLVFSATAVLAQDFIEVTLVQPNLLAQWRIEAEGHVGYNYGYLTSDDASGSDLMLPEILSRDLAPEAYPAATALLERSGFGRLHRFCQRATADTESILPVGHEVYSITWSRKGEEMTFSQFSCPEGYAQSDRYVEAIQNLSEDLAEIVWQTVQH